MRSRTRTLILIVTVVAVGITVSGIFIGQQVQIADQQSRIAELEATVAELDQTRRPGTIMRSGNRERPIALAPVYQNSAPTSRQDTTSIGVPWGVEEAMLMDGMAPQQQQLSR